MGVTNPKDAAPGTIRGDLALELTENLVHGSDGPESAAREIAIFFPISDCSASLDSGARCSPARRRIALGQRHSRNARLACPASEHLLERLTCA